MPASSAEERLRALGITLPDAPEPLGAYVPAVQTGNLLFLSGMVPVSHGKPAVVGRLGAGLELEDGRKAAYQAGLNGLAIAKKYLGSLNRVTKVVRLAVSVVSTESFIDQPKVADAVSELYSNVFGSDKAHSRIVSGIVSLPFNLPVLLEVILEVE